MTRRETAPVLGRLRSPSTRCRNARRRRTRFLSRSRGVGWRRYWPMALAWQERRVGLEPAASPIDRQRSVEAAAPAVRVSVGRSVPDPVARAWTESGGAVTGVGEPTAVERQTSAADAFGQPDLETLELGDPVFDPRRPRGREPGPVAASRCLVGRKLRELGADLVERQPDALSEDDERDPAEHRPPVAAVARARALGADQPALLVEAKGRGGHAAPACDLADGQQVGHVEARGVRT
jgi:hypothetical protein